MKKTLKFKSLSMLFSVLLIAFTIASCSSDDDKVTPDNPTISIIGDNMVTVKNGETINVMLKLNAPGNNKSLVVNRKGGFLEEIALQPTETEYTYSNQIVPSDAEEGEEYVYEFLLVDTHNQESGSVKFTVQAASYDEVTVLGKTLYNATITTDGIVPQGTNMKLISGRNYFISSPLLFEEGTSLTIEEGVHIYLDAEASTPVEIRVDDGATVSIIGTATDPVVFTSSKSIDGSAEPGDWDRFRYGDVQEGIFQYVRSEYADTGIRFGDVDNSNTIDHVTVYKAKDRGIYITNGNVDAKYLVAIDSEGGSFRIGDDYSGKLQFGIGWINERFTDNQELEIRETSSPTIANFTLLGPGVENENTHGVRLRANSKGKVYSTLVTEFPRRGVRLNDDVVVTDLQGETIFAYGYVVNVPRDPFRDDTDNGNPFQGYIDDDGNFQNPFFNNVTGLDGNDPILEEVAGIGPADFIPDSPITTKGSFDPTSIDSWFTSTTFVGAIENEANDWTKGWVKNPDGSIR